MNTVRIIAYYPGETPNYKRYTGSAPIPEYDDLTQIWELQNKVRDTMVININGRLYRVVRTAFPGLYTDKASRPGERSDWYPARSAYLWHDVDFSCHNWERFAINGDAGFRMTNLIFEATIEWFIADAVRRGVISRARSIGWRIRKRLWYRAVNSIAGQGRYVNGSPTRGNHGDRSTFAIY